MCLNQIMVMIMETKTGNTRNLLDISWGGLGDQCDIEIKDKD